MRVINQLHALFYKNILLIKHNKAQFLVSFLLLPAILYGFNLFVCHNASAIIRYSFPKVHVVTETPFAGVDLLRIDARAREQMSITLGTAFHADVQQEAACAKLPFSSVFAIDRFTPATKHYDFWVSSQNSDSTAVRNPGVSRLAGRIASNGRLDIRVAPGISVDTRSLLRSFIDFTTTAALISSVFVTACLRLSFADKQHNIVRLLRVNGMSVRTYFFGNFLFYLLLSISHLSLYFLAVVVYTIVYRKAPNDFAPMELLLKLFAHLLLTASLVSIYQVFGGLFQTVETAQRVAMFPVYGGMLAVMFIWGRGAADDWWFLAVLPGLSGSWLNSSVHQLGHSISLMSIFLRPRVRWALIAWTIQQALLMAIAWYLVFLQSEEGMDWWDPITRWFSKLKSTGADTSTQSSLEMVDKLEQRTMEEDVVKEMLRVDNAQSLQELSTAYPLLFSHIVKRYRHASRPAVDDVTLAVAPNQIFGLLGPNGAGKSTLLHIIAGVHRATSGKLFLDGIEAFANREAFLTKVSLCPQHDIYWPSLTCSEHLEIFAILRGADDIPEREVVLRTLDKVQLRRYADTAASDLSGGELRRLSIAMALSGDAPVILLDEPTTGLDPKVRRLIWEMIRGIREDRLVVLTTHSMEEAELLSDTLTIMAHGTLRCFGPPSHLKSKFGGRTFITCTFASPDDSQLINAFPGYLHKTFTSKDGKTMRYTFAGSDDRFAILRFIKRLQTEKTELGLASFGIKQSSLDDVFMNIVKESDADA